ncbi:uncharacterized protein MELLADRAFT_110526 [Melampsora larici-populina 98AG31]|uniref:SET domain-containing protein n=1 Tax=Melampsora larici-populina (strain 98AG31 / pathotype 3-4-7) TaxID=747676 RepID=F4S043_MELLP|nr:uncharacterized protein MELLADRAFT_110526 [Melampsora larici-populina 98AG31]EGG01899.1 hypothetical protein MELLADRAFT_110526 [Melampsora larici-populina 98AG31]
MPDPNSFESMEHKILGRNKIKGIKMISPNILLQVLQAVCVLSQQVAGIHRPHISTRPLVQDIFRSSLQEKTGRQEKPLPNWRSFCVVLQLRRSLEWSCYCHLVHSKDDSLNRLNGFSLVEPLCMAPNLTNHSLASLGPKTPLMNGTNGFTGISLHQNLNSDGLIYKFDKIKHQSIREDHEESSRLDGFVQQECYPHESDINNESFCIYLNSRFAQGRGVVFLSRPSVFMEALKSITIFKPNSKVLTDEKRNLRKFEVIDMPEKGGKGMIAKSRYNLGDLVITDHSIIAISVESLVWDRKDWGMIRKKMVDYLPIQTRAAFATMHAIGETEEIWIESAISRNGFEFSIGEDEVPFFAVIPEPARLNHDCRANAAFHFDESTLQVYMYAIRDIAPGEEVTISYRDMKLSREERRIELKHYGFECQCSLCSLPSHAVEVSDSRIRQIDELTAHLIDWSPTSKATPTMAEHVLELYKLERLDTGLEEAYTMVSLAYNAVGDSQRASMYASLAIARGIILNGPKWEEYDAVLELEQSPETHWSYRRRET